MRRGSVPISARRLAILRKLLVDCEAAYESGSGDFVATENIVETYRCRTGQLKYVHMYFAKSVACWRYLRRTLRIPNDGPVWSFGAGPCTCLLGWFFDVAPDEGQGVVAVDALRWKFVHDLPSHAAVIDDVLGPDVDFEVLHHRYFPAGQHPQLGEIAKLTPIEPDEVPVGATVLLPFVLNHMVGWLHPMRRPAPLWSWLESVRARAARIIVVDMQWDPDPNKVGIRDFWKNVGAGLGVTGRPRVMTFREDIRLFSDAYSPKDNWPRRRTSDHMSQATVLLGDGSGWRYA